MCIRRALSEKMKLGLDALSQEINGIKKSLEEIKGKQKLDRDHLISKTLLTLEVLQKNTIRNNSDKIRINNEIRKIIGEELKNPS